ncbi:MAG: glycogen/starch/alpha-glucan phosphorylase [Lachnospiraceae bacterium]|nr:glycogen/starch/alpha-glucan phosphorylase [Lachnospiraceae bacterium]
MSFRGLGNKKAFKEEYLRILNEYFSKPAEECTDWEKYEALVYLIKEHSELYREDSVQNHKDKEDKKVFYFSMEFLIGKLLENYLIAADIRDLAEECLGEMGIDLQNLLELDPDPGLGNGGLGRLAACFLDSMASMNIYATGMGIRYRFGLFKQKIENGYQVEYPDAWLSNGYPWETPNPSDCVEVRFGGEVERRFENGQMIYEHKNYTPVKATPYSVNIIGRGGKSINRLKLWSASLAEDTLDMEAFNRGDYSNALGKSAEIEAINCILYPDDSMGEGRKLRLMQEYFFVAAGIARIVKGYKKDYGMNAWKDMPKHTSIHINDTHPTLCVPELMRVLIDEEGMEWDDAWEITKNTISFTNHTVLPEALEKWPIPLMQSLLPRVYMIIEEIDRRWRENLEKVRKTVYDTLRYTAILWDGEVRMANLSIIGSHSINGVAKLHTEILKNDVFRTFHKIMPEAFNNKTNGVSHRRFLVQSNPDLAKLITSCVGDDWIDNMSQVEGLLKYKDDPEILSKLSEIKRINKVRLSNYIMQHGGPEVDPDSIFDVQVKRIHAYKRQLLNAFKVLNLYNELRNDPFREMEPVTFIFSGKAAQGYAYAKEVIKFINSVADLVNKDPVISEKIKVVFIENFSVSSGQLIYPAADISEQISTAGKEASGTGNMKFMMNGAITLGTLDGANVEIREEVGDENIKIFGLTAEETDNFYKNGGYSASQTAEADGRISHIMSQLVDGTFADSGMYFWGIYDSMLKHNDEFFVLKDFDAYIRAWNELTALHRNTNEWNKIALVNIAKSGYFSSDRTIAEYARDIWHL